MGNNSKKSNYTYTTGAGYKFEVQSEDEYSLVEEVEQTVSHWINNMDEEIPSPDSIMEDDVYQWIINHMDSSSDLESQSLTRVEYGHHFRESNYKEGDLLEDPAHLRSYSQDLSASLNLIDKFYEGDVVLYKTVGETPHFDTTKFEDHYGVEKESFMNPNQQRISKITTLNGGEVKQYFEKELPQYDLEKYELPSKMTVVETRYDGSVEYPTPNNEYLIRQRQFFERKGSMVGPPTYNLF